jgi:peptide deformylase
MTVALMPRTRAEAEALTLRLWPDPVLDMQAEEVLPEEMPHLQLLLNRMRFIMDMSRGIGIAAPQLGVLKKIFLISERVRAPRHVFVNPTVIPLGRTELMREGCLSVPGADTEISRKVMVRAYTDGVKDGLLLTGQAAHVAQHEYEHLQGIIRVAARL